MKSVDLRRVSLGIILDPAINIRMADGVCCIVAEKAGKIGDRLLALLTGLNREDLVQIVPEE